MKGTAVTGTMKVSSTVEYGFVSHRKDNSDVCAKVKKETLTDLNETIKAAHEAHEARGGSLQETDMAQETTAESERRGRRTRKHVGVLGGTRRTLSSASTKGALCATGWNPGFP